MSAILHILVWEWINIALECAATAWVRLPRFPLAVAGVNLVTHPMLMLLLSIWGREPRVVLPLEAVVVVAEWAMLCALYRGRDRRDPAVGSPGELAPPCDRAEARPTSWFLFAVSLIMNATSYGTGLLLDLACH